MRFYKIALYKAYFEKGYGLSHYLFKVVAVIGITANKLEATIYAIIVYTILCFLLGLIVYKSKFVEAENEVQNVVNPFQQEVRHAISSKALIAKKRNI